MPSVTTKIHDSCRSDSKFKDSDLWNLKESAWMAGEGGLDSTSIFGLPTEGKAPLHLRNARALVIRRLDFPI